MNISEKQKNLFKMRGIATGLLILMAIVFVVTKLLEKNNSLWSYVVAFAEAAMVGALADWFAVVALFRHPLGLPIPHTAILPNNKDRIAKSLSDFVVENFLTREGLLKQLSEVDFAGRISALILDKKAEISETVTHEIIPRLLNALNDEDIKRLIQQQLHAGAKSVQVSPLLGNLLSLLTSGDKYLPLFKEVIEYADKMISENKGFICQKIQGKLPAIIPYKENLAGLIFDIFYLNPIQEIKQSSNPELALRFKSKIDEIVQNLRTSPEYIEKGEEIKNKILGDSTLQQYIGKIWTEVKQWVNEDISKADSKIKEQIQRGLDNLANALQNDEKLQKKLNDGMLSALLDFIDKHRHKAGEYIENTVKAWKAEEMTNKLEEEIGRDLQFIRLNGTIVGGLVGLFLYSISRFF